MNFAFIHWHVWCIVSHHVLHMHAQERGRSVVQQYAKRLLKPSPSRTPDLRRAAVRDHCEQAMGRCSLGVPTRHGDDRALAWHAALGRRRLPYQWRGLSLRAQALEQHCGTLPRDICMHARFEQAMGRCSLGAPTRHGDDGALAWHAAWGRRRRTSGVAFPFALKRLSNTAARTHAQFEMLTRSAHAAWRRWGFGMARCVGTFLLTSGADVPFVLERLRNPPARPQEASPRSCNDGYTNAECMTLWVYVSDAAASGAVDVLGAMVERGER